MKLTTLTPLTAIFAILPSAAAWGSLGHETVAYIASNFVAAQTKNVFQTLLHNETSSYLASVATWADSFRYTQAGRFSAPFHYIDAEDNPPTSCGVTYSRDCGAKGCVVGAIQNYVSIIHTWRGQSGWYQYSVDKPTPGYYSGCDKPKHGC